MEQGPGQEEAEARSHRALFVPFLRDERFVGRQKDLASLHALLRTEKAAGVAVRTGMSGIGKTALAVEYAYRHRDEYPGGVYWVNAAESWVGELSRLGDRVGLREDESTEEDRPKRLARAFLEHVGERADALLIFDHVDDPAALRRPIEGLIPADLGCRLLFTTRRRDGAGAFAMLAVRELPEEAALDLLLGSEARRGLRAEPSELETAKTIVAMLGYLPLALALARAYLDHDADLSLGEHRDRLRMEGAFAADEGGLVTKDLLTRHKGAMRATLRLAWGQLTREAERRTLCAAALLGEAAVIPAARLALLTGLGEETAEGLRRLGEIGLVEVLSKGAVRLHPLVKEFAERQLKGREAFETACAGRLGAALGEPGRLQDEVAARGVDAVIEDLRAGAGRFERLMGVLKAEAQALRGWDPAKEPGFLLQQIRNRCFEEAIDEVRKRTEALLEERQWPWLRERRRTGGDEDGHRDSVYGVAVTADGRLAISGSYDRRLAVREIESGRLVRWLEGHGSPVSGVVVTADGQWAVSGSHGKSPRIWELESGRTVRTLEGHTAPVNGVAVTADGRWALSVSQDRTLRVWELGSGRLIRTLEGHTAAVCAVAVTGDGRVAVSASEDRTLKIWDVAGGRELRALEGHTAAVCAVAVTGDGRVAVSASKDRTLKVWEIGSGRLLRTLEGHTSAVSGVAVTGDGRVAVSASWDGTLAVWDLASGERWARLRVEAPLQCCAVVGDGSVILAGDDAGGVHLLDWVHPERE